MKKHSYVKFFTVATAATLAISTMTMPTQTKANNAFSDVPTTSVFYGPIMDLFNRGIISGFPDFSYRPNTLLTRGQAAKIIARTLNLLPTTNDASFPDVAPSHEYYLFVMALKERDIISGFPDGTFRLHEPITRNQMAKMIAHAFALKSDTALTLPFTDVMTSYSDAIGALYSHEVTVGRTPTSFDGSAYVTRAQMAAFVSRAEMAMKERDNTPYELTFFANGYTDDAIEIRGKTYKFSEAVRPIFSAENKIALQNAELTVTVENGVVTKVHRLALNHPGSKRDVVTFSAQAEVDYLNVNANYVVVRDLIVLRGAVASSTVDEEIYFENANIRGILTVGETDVVGSLQANTVLSGPKIVLKGTSLSNVQVQGAAAAIVSDQTVPLLTLAPTVGAIDLETDIGSMQVQSARDIALTGQGDVQALTLTRAVKMTLDVAGTVDELTVLDANAKLTLGQSTKVTTYNLPDGMTLNQFLTNPPSTGTVPPIQMLLTFSNSGQNVYNLNVGDVFTAPIVTDAAGRTIMPAGQVDLAKQGTYMLTYTAAGYETLTITVNVTVPKTFLGNLVSTMTVGFGGRFALPLITDEENNVVAPVLRNAAGDVLTMIDTSIPGTYTATYAQQHYTTHVLTITVVNEKLHNVRYESLDGQPIDLTAMRVYQKNSDDVEVDVTNKELLAKGTYYFELLAPTYMYNYGSFEVKGNTLVIIKAISNE